MESSAARIAGWRRMAARGSRQSWRPIFGWIFAPVAFVIGVPLHDCLAIGNLLGTRMVLNELVAFTLLGAQKAALDPRSFTIATFALCGFANISSIGIQIGGLGALAPNRRARPGAPWLPRHDLRYDGESDVGLHCGDFSMNTAPMNTAMTAEPDEFTRAEQAAQSIRAALAQNPALGMPRMAVVLGSGLGDFADSLQPALVIAYGQIPFFPRSTAIGHAGRLVIGKIAQVTVAVMQGRVHPYEGYSAKQAAFPIRVFGRLGVRALVLTNAAGGINPQYGEGALVLIGDHINLQGANPLSGANDERFGPRFPDMTEAYSRVYRRIALEAGRKHGIELHEGIYAALAGPSYETPAEIRYLRAIGADLVGMSTVPEVIVARHMGIGVLAISCVTNMAAGLQSPEANDGPLGDPRPSREINHQEVLATGRRVRGKLLALLGEMIPAIDGSLPSPSRRA